MKNMMQMMKQAQEMQKNVKRLQSELESMEFTGTSSSDLVTVKMTGKNEVTSISINPEAVDVDDLETLEALVAMAVNDAHTKAQTHIDAQMKSVTGGMNLPF